MPLSGHAVFWFASAIYCSKCSDILERVMTVILWGSFFYVPTSRYHNHFTSRIVEHGCFQGNFIQLAPAVLIHADIMEFFHLPTVNNAYQLRKRGKLREKNSVTDCVECLRTRFLSVPYPKLVQNSSLFFKIERNNCCKYLAEFEKQEIRHRWKLCSLNLNFKVVKFKRERTFPVLRNTIMNFNSWTRIEERDQRC